MLTVNFQDLRERAESILNNTHSGIEITHKSILQLINELELHRVELQIQNEDLVRTQQELYESRRKYINLYEFAPKAYFTLNANGLIMNVNEAGAHLFGVAKNHLLNKAFTRYIDPNYQLDFQRHKQIVLAQNEIQTCEVKLLRKNNALFHAQMTSKRMEQDDCLLTFISDITDRKDKERLSYEHQMKIANIERLNAIGELASNFTYELNSPLAAITNYIYGCINRIKSDNYKENDLIYGMTQALNQIQRIYNVLLKMKNFTCKGTLKLEPFSLHEIIKDAVNSIQSEIFDYPIAITVRRSKDYLLCVDKIHLEQVIINVTRNAVEAMRDHNTQGPSLIIEINQTSTDWIEVSIMDNGPGISAEINHKIFDPQYTSKPYGIGLGLSLSQAIIEAHGGKIILENNPIGGACVTFTLPLHALPTT